MDGGDRRSYSVKTPFRFAAAVSCRPPTEPLFLALRTASHTIFSLPLVAAGSAKGKGTWEARQLCSHTRSEIRPKFSNVVSQAITDSTADQKPRVIGYQTPR